VTPVAAVDRGKQIVGAVAFRHLAALGTPGPR
jgi:hypothetical protein